jgi:hypothetical protein
MNMVKIISSLIEIMGMVLMKENKNGGVNTTIIHKDVDECNKDTNILGNLTMDIGNHARTIIDYGKFANITIDYAKFDDTTINNGN